VAGEEAGPRRRGNRLQDRRCHRHEARHRQDGDDPGPRRDLLCADRSDGRRPLRPAHRGIAAARREAAGVPGELVQAALDLEITEGSVIADRVGDDPCVFLAGLYRAEQIIAERILCLANGALPWPHIDPEKALPWIEQRTRLQLAESQIAAIRLALLTKVLVITGGPGVGKTTIVNSILRLLSAKGTSLLLCAPTGRAAKRTTEARVRGQDHSPDAGGRPEGRRFQTQHGEPVSLRPAGGADHDQPLGWVLLSGGGAGLVAGDAVADRCSTHIILPPAKSVILISRPVQGPGVGNLVALLLFRVGSDV
jgi:hypothetical protein